MEIRTKLKPQNNQAPRNNNQTITNNQIPITKQNVWSLVIEYWNLFGNCILVIGYCVMIFLLSFGIWNYFLYAQEIKEPNVAGSFYPDNSTELSQMIDKFIETANPEPLDGEIFALISPHAGYGFSGQTAAYGYNLIKNKPYKTVIVLGTSHQYGFSGVSVYPEGIFRTPLGDLEIDKEFTKELLSKSRSSLKSQAAWEEGRDKDKEIFFEPAAFAKEHSVEVQLPFLQKVLTGFRIVPIVIGDCSLSACEKLANLLKEAIGERKDVLVIASSDMAHRYDYEEVETIDNTTLSYLKRMDFQGLYYGFRENKLEMCGMFPVVTTIILAKELRHNQLSVLKYTNSAIVTGKKSKGMWTVGYVSCAIDQAPLEPIGRQKEEMGSLTGQEKGEAAMLNKEQRKKLLEIARKSIETYLKTGKKLELTETDPILLKEMGAFVTLHRHGELRGCIGNLIGNQPLYLTVRDMAIEAATGDPRFLPVELNELKSIEIEISALSPMQRIDSPDKIQLGIHGVLVKKGFTSGVFLPQVAQETGWTKEEFLSNLCAHKAGLSPDAWKDKSTEIYIFTAEVFSEKEN